MCIRDRKKTRRRKKKTRRRKDKKRTRRKDKKRTRRKKKSTIFPRNKLWWMFYCRWIKIYWS